MTLMMPTNETHSPIREILRRLKKGSKRGLLCDGTECNLDKRQKI